MSSPSQSRSDESFFLSLSLSRPSACPFSPVSRSFPPHLLSRSFLPRQSTVQVHVQDRGALSGFTSPLPGLFWPPSLLLSSLLLELIGAAVRLVVCAPRRLN